MGTAFVADVVTARDEHLDHTGALHAAELPHGLFPLLGVRFVRRWHRAHLRSPHGVVLVAMHDGVPVGFLVGTADRHANVSWIIEHHRRELIAAGVRALARRPALALWFVRSRGPRYARRLLGRRASARVAAPGRLPEAPFAPVAVLEAVVVAPGARGHGVASALVRAYLEIVADAGVRRAELVTKAGSAGAAGFYERTGWHRVGSHVDRDGDDVLTYRIDPFAAASQ
ncbi:acetyltransferase (GNAT) family protein [Haloactinopolyspora alba]|uniref:Acetyltransferase (GNAT) family protein n=1 Tax=Haloactinopolyspora alba TaxID=648780 RepID=A0A2P8E938_9ACTN|nr:GNAT family N-acetyltransferase [Haloactinopolyspora alba]PSL06000.1 acetyltransferase (GNAT) family protein [Haloactinopolyspora alba]